MELPKNDGGCKNFVDESVDLEKSALHLCADLITDTQDATVNGNLQLQPSSSSGCIEEYLADPVEGDSANSVSLIESSLNPANNVFPLSANDVRDATNSLKGISEFSNKSAAQSRQDSLSKQDEVRHKENLRSDVEQVNDEEVRRFGEWQSNMCPNIESHLSVDHASEKLQCRCSGVQNASRGCGEKCNCNLECRQIDKAYEDYGENAEAIADEPVDNNMDDLMVSQHQRGMSRRCLQFEEARPKPVLTRSSSLSLENNLDFSRSPSICLEAKTSDYYLADSNVASSNRQGVNVPQPTASMSRPHNTGKSSILVSKPLGIGLHLNSIVNAVPMCRATTDIKLPDGYVSVQEMKAASTHCDGLEAINSSANLPNLVRKEDKALETKASLAACSAIPESLDTLEQLNSMQLTDQNATPCNKRISEHADSFEEPGQQSPRRKKKKSSNTTEGGGCKRCNCKKSKCLKLYCDCFAAGIYCAEPCSCQGCFNRPEYEDTVLETRQQIESRNPLAFAPKVIQRVPEFPAKSGEDGNIVTPSSARHKRGCNCKRSLCLKKYCECYQANVGCSTGCRCEGCKNIYGRKEEYIATVELVRNRSSDEKLEEKMEMVVNEEDVLRAGMNDVNKLIPVTPSFQCSDHVKDGPRSMLLSRKYLPSPDCNIATLPSYTKSPSSPRRLDNNDMILATDKETQDMGIYDQEADYSNADILPYFSSKRDSLTDVCQISPSNPRLMAVGSLSSSKTRERTGSFRLQLCSGSGHVSSAGSLRWRSSPITPMTQLGGSKGPQGPDSEDGLYGILDDTPEILEDTSTPTKSVKVSSPNQKRVSPPHGRLHELGSSSSGFLKSGRKFILRSVPSFPPLTPCVESRSISNQTAVGSPQKSQKE